MAHDGNRRHVGNRDVVKPTHGRAAESAAGRLDEVVAMAGLVVEGGDPAVGVGAEGVLRGRVGVSARIRRGGLDDADVQGLAVRLAHNLVQRAVVGGIKRARGTVRGHTRGAGCGIDVTGAFRPGRGNIASRPACAATINMATGSVNASTMIIKKPIRVLGFSIFIFLSYSLNQDSQLGALPVTAKEIEEYCNPPCQ